MTLRVVVLGAGALGSLYAAWSADAGHEVWIVGRSQHVAAVNRDGLTVCDRSDVSRSVKIRAISDVREAPDADVVLLASKGPDSLGLLAGYRGAPIAAWSIQNGARQAEPLVSRFGPAAIGCVSMVGATLKGPGIVAHTFDGMTYVGSLCASNSRSVQSVTSSLSGDAGVVVRDDIESVLWSKAVLAAAAMGMSVLLRLPYHHVFAEPGARETFYSIVSDAARVAAAEGATLVDLPGPMQAGSLMAVPRDRALAALEHVGSEMLRTGQTSVRVSMLQSLETGRRLEEQAVFGDLIELADQHGLDVPVLRAVANVVSTLDEVGRRSLGASPIRPHGERKPKS